MPVSRDDIEAKAMQIVDAVTETQEAVKDRAVWGVLAAAGLVVAAFVLGRRRSSQKKKTVVEVYRI
ncbi:MAG: hypothetical protein DIU67_007355 [Actinomycetes bacterium]|jgi:site-specific recombinase XerC